MLAVLIFFTYLLICVCVSLQADRCTVLQLCRGLCCMGITPDILLFLRLYRVLCPMGTTSSQDMVSIMLALTNLIIACSTLTSTCDFFFHLFNNTCTCIFTAGHAPVPSSPLSYGHHFTSGHGVVPHG